MCSTDLKHGTSRKKCQGGACHQERNVRTLEYYSIIIHCNMTLVLLMIQTVHVNKNLPYSNSNYS